MVIVSLLHFSGTVVSIIHESDESHAKNCNNRTKTKPGILLDLYLIPGIESISKLVWLFKLEDAFCICFCNMTDHPEFKEYYLCYCTCH